MLAVATRVAIANVCVARWPRLPSCAWKLACLSSGDHKTNVPYSANTARIIYHVDLFANKHAWTWPLETTNNARMLVVLKVASAPTVWLQTTMVNAFSQMNAIATWRTPNIRQVLKSPKIVLYANVLTVHSNAPKTSPTVNYLVTMRPSLHVWLIVPVYHLTGFV